MRRIEKKGRSNSTQFDKYSKMEALLLTNFANILYNRKKVINFTCFDIRLGGENGENPYP